MSTEEGLVIDNAVVILHVVRDEEHKLLSPPYGKHSELVREACWLSMPLATSNLQNIVAE
jgi:hypothetical protein